MKILAYTKPEFQGELITVYEALRRRKEDPDAWEGRTYFDILRSRPMTASDRGAGSSSFSYKGGAGGGHGRGSKGIAHELAQEFLCRQKEFKFRAFGNEFLASVADTEDEVYVVDPQNNKRNIFVDVMLTLADNCPMRTHFGDRIAIEITDTHANTNRKMKLLRELGIGALEVKIPKDWHIKNETHVTSQDLNLLKRRIDGFWQVPVFVQIIHSQTRL